MNIVNLTIDLLKKEPNMVRVPEPCVFIGDIHGQYYDLHHILRLIDRLHELNHVFLGDYVDRGMFSVEVILLLYAIKLNYPKSVFLLRGNHECRQMA